MESEPRGVTTAAIVCTYQGRRFVEDQLESILGQTHPLDRVYVVDDASTDGTWTLLQNRYGSHRRVVLSQNPVNLGYVKNFERALGLVKEDIVFFSDQDDVWSAEKVEVYLKAFQDEVPAGLVFGDLALIDEGGNPLGSTLWQRKGFTKPGRTFCFEDCKPTLAGRNVVTGASMALWTAEAQRAIPFPEGMPHDHYLTLRTVAQGKRVVALEEPWGTYRLHPGQTLGAGNLPSKRSADWKDRMLRLQRKIHPLQSVQRARPLVDAVLRGSLKRELSSLKRQWWAAWWRSLIPKGKNRG